MNERNQTPAAGNPARLAAHEKKAPALVTAAQAARDVFGISERKFHDLRSEPWMPPAVVLGPRILRWVRSELEAAAVNMPRQKQPQVEPAQLLRARIKHLKTGKPQ